MIEFTFQYGEIKSGFFGLNALHVIPFTFQYGEIKSAFCRISTEWFTGFTFQYGEIKSRASTLYPVSDFDLHSSMERLKVVSSAAALCQSKIYIPVWRD